MSVERHDYAITEVCTLRYSVELNISKTLLSPEKTSCRKEQVGSVMSFNS